MPRKDYQLKCRIKFGCEKDFFFALPTVIYIPWKYRYIGVAAIELRWLFFYACYGDWQNK